VLVHHAPHAAHAALRGGRLARQRLQARPRQRRGEVQVQLRVEAGLQVASDSSDDGVARARKVQRGHLRDRLPLRLQKQVQRHAVAPQVGHVQQRRDDVAREAVQHEHLVHLLAALRVAGGWRRAAERVEHAQEGLCVRRVRGCGVGATKARAFLPRPQRERAVEGRGHSRGRASDDTKGNVYDGRPYFRRSLLRESGGAPEVTITHAESP